MSYIRSHFSTYDKWMIFLNVIKKDPQVRVKINDMLDA